MPARATINASRFAARVLTDRFLLFTPFCSCFFYEKAYILPLRLMAKKVAFRSCGRDGPA
jgi:hypothetical protein